MSCLDALFDVLLMSFVDVLFDVLFDVVFDVIFGCPV
jgi:hypothetical protein